MPKISRLRIFVGPNGSGKSTLFEAINEKFYSGHFVNADLLESEISARGYFSLDRFGIEASQADFNLFCKSENASSLIAKSVEANKPINFCIKDNLVVVKSKCINSYEASLISSFIKLKMFDTKQSFSYETVMSHPSKLEEIKLAKSKGYKIYLYFICVDDPEINILRVQDRVSKGGHDVDVNKIISRYQNTLDLLLDAIKLSDRSYLFDNSDTMKLVAESENNKITLLIKGKSLPNWLSVNLINKLQIE